jgi:FeS assembly SUF system regulator
MLKISKLADYATVIMSFLALKPGQVWSAVQIAEQVQVAAPAVSKVLKLLAKANIVTASRGAVGGYRLVRSSMAITVAEIIAAVDGAPALTECSQKNTLCAQHTVCAIRGNWQLINRIVLQALQSISLAEMTRPLNSQTLLQQIQFPMKSEKKQRVV